MYPSYSNGPVPIRSPVKRSISSVCECDVGEIIAAHAIDNKSNKGAYGPLRCIVILNSPTVSICLIIPVPLENFHK